jgi:hypothetical protein
MKTQIPKELEPYIFKNVAINNLLIDYITELTTIIERHKAHPGLVSKTTWSVESLR